MQAVRQIEFKCQAKDRLLVCPNLAQMGQR